jgi:phospholipid/cholesterol/gamma-HCH transport system ATP-binding protein
MMNLRLASIRSRQLINQVRDKYHTSSIIITHDITCAHDTGDRIVALIDGKNALEGTFEELRKTKHPDLQAFFAY